MGTLKFYRPMQAVWEMMQFGSCKYTTTSFAYNDEQSKFRYCGSDGLSGYFFENNSLTTPNVNTIYPVIMPAGTSASAGGTIQAQPFMFQNANYGGNSCKGNLHATSNSTHDATRNSLSNKVSGVSVAVNQKTSSTDGKMSLSITITNSGEVSATVNAIERVCETYATATYGSASSSNKYFFLAWAYYLDEPIELDAGESKSIIIDFQFPDLTL